MGFFYQEEESRKLPVSATREILKYNDLHLMVVKMKARTKVLKIKFFSWLILLLINIFQTTLNLRK